MIKTNLGNWDDLWEGVENDLFAKNNIEEEKENKVFDTIEEVQKEAAFRLIGRCW